MASGKNSKNQALKKGNLGKTALQPGKNGDTRESSDVAKSPPKGGPSISGGADLDG